MTGRRKILAALALTGAAATATVPATCSGPASHQLVVGVTHGQRTAQPGTIGYGVLRDVPIQNQHLMGWGTLSPEPTPGVYDWSTLDERIALIQSTGAEPVLTLCCAPDWMKGGAAGTTDWTRLEVAPTEEHFEDFARLAAAAARRYPQVNRFQVWNELKGFWSTGKNRWDYEGYTRLYNLVYAAVKKVRPDALVGGPYAPLELYRSAPVPSAITGPWGTVDRRALDAVDYWLAHNVGADFVAVDGWSITRDAGYLTDPVTAAGVFEAVTAWLRARTDLPIWWSELYAADAAWSFDVQAKATAAALDGVGRAGGQVVLLWEPQAIGPCRGCLWTDPALGPVVVTPLADVVAHW